MRAIWKGAVSFGLVNVPIRLYSAVESHDIRFHQVHDADDGRIRYKRTCSECGKEVAYDDIVKGYETESGELVKLSNEELTDLPLPSGHEIDVVEFVETQQVDPMLLDRSYYLVPETKGLKAYTLLRQALEATDRMAIAKVALRKRETLAALHVRDTVIVLQTMRWPDEIRAADFDVLDNEVDLRDKEVQMANSLVEQMAADFDPSQFEDEYAEAVQELVEAKVEGGDVSDVPAQKEAKSGSDVIDLTSALEKSLKSGSGRGSQRKSTSKGASKKKSSKAGSGG